MQQDFNNFVDPVSLEAGRLIFMGGTRIGCRITEDKKVVSFLDGLDSLSSHRHVLLMERIFNFDVSVGLVAGVAVGSVVMVVTLSRDEIAL